MSNDARKTIRLPEKLIKDIKTISNDLNLSENDTYKFLLYCKTKELSNGKI